MTKSATEKTVDGGAFDLFDEVRESAKAGQHGAGKALRAFSHAVDHAIPENLQPLRRTKRAEPAGSSDIARSRGAGISSRNGGNSPCPSQ